jgi:DNA repair exonuclease SbcCD ATPase subunit
MMMQEILKPLLENDVLTDEVKSSIETALTEAFTAKEEAVRAEVEEVAKENFEAAKAKFEETYKTLEESYKTKLDEATETTEAVKAEIEDLESKIEDLETKPFVNVSESDMEAAEAKLVEELEAKYEKAFDLGKEKFNNTFELVAEANAEVVAELEAHIENQDVVVDELTAKVEELTEALESKDEELAESIETNSTVEDQIAAAVAETEERMRAEAEEKIEAIKENLVTSTEIFLEQELAEVKADKAEIMKETQGRELLESIKGLVKQYWDIDSEVAEEILEMKKEAESKVEQYKDMLKKEHNRLEESQAEIESLKKKVIVESRGSVLADDKKEALEKLAENMDSDKLETNIDNLMESVVSAFNSGFSKKEIVDAVEEEVTKTETVEEEVLAESVQTVISSGDSEVKTSDELAEILAFAGVRK